MRSATRRRSPIRPSCRRSRTAPTRRRALKTDRELGIELYNKTWTLAGEEALHSAHASAYHWMHAEGATTANRARSEWLCARVYSDLGRAEPALYHARRCLELVESDPGVMEDWDLPGAYEALARAHAVSGDAAEAARYRDLGLAAVARVADAEDAEHIEADLRGIQVPSANVGRTERPG